MTNVEEGFELVGMSLVSKEEFKEGVTAFQERMELDETYQLDESYDVPTISIMYRDSANYKYGFSLQLNEQGQVLIVEPEWTESEARDGGERDLFLDILFEEFGRQRY